MESTEVIRMVAPLRGWGLVCVAPITVVLFAPPSWPGWLYMWILAISIFAGCKWLTWRRSSACGRSWWIQAGYLMAWPGLDPRAFFQSTGEFRNGSVQPGEWWSAWIKLGAGAILFWGISRLVPPGQEILLGWVGMIGLILMLHFGSFHLLSCKWRTIGINAQPLMKSPLASNSISEFWGKRWNTAFRDLTHRFLFRPLSHRMGPRKAIVVGFFFSGLVHEVVISLPAGGGYGGPTLYFLIQGVAMLFERSPMGRSLIQGNRWREKFFMVLIVAAPAGLLLNATFIRNIIIPFMHMAGAV